MNIYMEKHLLHPQHPKFEPYKWNSKYIKNSHNCYAYAMNTIKKKFIKTCKHYSKMNKHKKTMKYKSLNKKNEKIGYIEYDSITNLCSYVRPQIGLYLKKNNETKKNNAKKFNAKKFNAKKLEKLFLKENPTIKKLKKGENCPYGYYRIFLYYWRKNKNFKQDYHFLRQDNTGKWSHKHGTNLATKIKEKTPEKYIDKYKKKKNIKIEICGYYAVPIKGRKNLENLYYL